MNKLFVTYEWVMSHVGKCLWTRQHIHADTIKHIHKHTHTYSHTSSDTESARETAKQQKGGWVKSWLWMSHVSGMNESCHTDERVMSHIWMTHVTHTHTHTHTCTHIHKSTHPYIFCRKYTQSVQSSLLKTATHCVVCCSILQKLSVGLTFTNFSTNYPKTHLSRG